MESQINRREWRDTREMFLLAPSNVGATEENMGPHFSVDSHPVSQIVLLLLPPFFVLKNVSYMKNSPPAKKIQQQINPSLLSNYCNPIGTCTGIGPLEATGTDLLVSMPRNALKETSLGFIYLCSLPLKAKRFVPNLLNKSSFCSHG